MAELADPIGHASMVVRQPRYSGDSILMAAETVFRSSQRMSNREWRNSRLVVTPGTFHGTHLILSVTTDTTEMVNVSYAGLVQIVWIEGGVMALLAGWSFVSTIVMAHITILDNTLMQFVVK
jgi:hypothetical protein